jgi:predicted aspartyl protease
MIVGTVTADGEPVVLLRVGGREWRAIIDTGFNGNLDLPDTLRGAVNPRYTADVLSVLAGGVEIIEDGYDVDFPFDGRTIAADATFVDGETILVGTRLLRAYRLEIDFVACTVKLERVVQP